MADFTLDTSGAVIPLAGQPIGGTEAARFWSDLSPFTQGYIEALFASELENFDAETADQSGMGPGGYIPAFSDLAPETLARIIADCEAMAAQGLPDKLEHHQRAGRSAWEWRQLQQRPGFPPLTVQLGDDGLVKFAA